MPRADITPAQATYILNRYGRKCLACGRRDDVQIDHVVPVPSGGTDNLRNLQPLCRLCNKEKADRTIDYRGWRGCLPLRLVRRYAFMRGLMKFVAKGLLLTALACVGVLLLPGGSLLASSVAASAWSSLLAWIVTTQALGVVIGLAALLAVALHIKDRRELVYPDEFGRLPIAKGEVLDNPQIAAATWQAAHVRDYERAIRHGPTHFTYSPKWPTSQRTEDALPAPPPPLPLSSWFPLVCDHDAHLLLLGPTRSGKSTLARALLAERAKTDRIVVLDPHASAKTWGGVPAAGIGRKFDEIETMILTLHREFERRYPPDEAHTPISVFIDETPAIAAECKHLIQYITKWLREAAKVQIRLVVLSQGWEVRALGIEGEGSIRENFKTVKLGSFAIDELPEAEQHAYPAVLVHGNGKGVPRLIDTAGLPERAAASLSPDVVWQPDPALLLTTTTTDGPKNDENDDTGRRRRILELADQGWKPTPIAIEVLGNDSGRNVRYVKAVLEDKDDL